MINKEANRVTFNLCILLELLGCEHAYGQASSKCLEIKRLLPMKWQGDYAVFHIYSLKAPFLFLSISGLAFLWPTLRGN